MPRKRPDQNTPDPLSRLAQRQADLDRMPRVSDSSYNLNRLQELMNQGGLSTSSSSGALTQDLLREAMNQLKAAPQPQRGSWGDMTQGQTIRFTEYTAPPRPQPMQPPKFNIGDKVTVRRGETVFTVHHFQQERDQYAGGVFIQYFLENPATGAQTREPEQDLKPYDEVAARAIPKPKVDFNTVVIADEKREQILEALEQVNQSDLIFKDWGFGETIEKGRGVSMLFYGPPGTGKTLMAQAIANKMEKTLKVISTADIESSAPGEAERNIRKHFADAKDGKTILLFDECDSLIFNRANTGPILGAQINELLSQIEKFDGITLFTTNRLGTLDEAVNRRLALKLEFGMPSPEERVEIWKRMFPKKAPLGKDIDWELLAEFEITGGYIKNAVLRAARAAATEPIANRNKKIEMKHLKKALRFELQSMSDFEDARDVEEHRNMRTVGKGVAPSSQSVVRTGSSIERKIEEEVVEEAA